MKRERSFDEINVVMPILGNKFVLQTQRQTQRGALSHRLDGKARDKEQNVRQFKNEGLMGQVKGLVGGSVCDGSLAKLRGFYPTGATSANEGGDVYGGGIQQSALVTLR